MKSRALIICLLLCAALTGCNLTKGTATPYPTPDLPTVYFQAPANNSRVIENTPLPFDIVANDAGAGVAKIELFVDGASYQTVTPQVNVAVPTFTVQVVWPALGLGLHPVSAIAYRLDGTRSDEALINIEVVTG